MRIAVMAAGVVKDDIPRQSMGTEHVIGGVSYIAATIAEPGLVRHSGTLRSFIASRFDGATLHVLTCRPAQDISGISGMREPARRAATG